MKGQTLKENKDFRRLYYRGKNKAGSVLVTYALKNKKGHNAIGITTGKKIGGAGELTLKIFAPPASGENDITNEDGRYNYYYTLEKLPRIRISSKPVAKCK